VPEGAAPIPRYHAVMTREELARRIAEMSLVRGEFELRSGRMSSYYVDKYQFSTQPDVLRALGELFAERINAIGQVSRLAGAELGGIPLVCSASMATGIPCIFIRNRKKEYGTGKQLEGQLNPGDRVVVLEDVATTGGQVLEAARVIRDAGGEVVRIIATIDRQEGARENIEKAGHAFEALFTVADLGVEQEVRG